MPILTAALFRCTMHLDAMLIAMPCISCLQACVCRRHCVSGAGWCSKASSSSSRRRNGPGHHSGQLPTRGQGGSPADLRGGCHQLTAPGSAGGSSIPQAAGHASLQVGPLAQHAWMPSSYVPDCFMWQWTCKLLLWHMWQHNQLLLFSPAVTAIISALSLGLFVSSHCICCSHTTLIV